LPWWERAGLLHGLSMSSGSWAALAKAAGPLVSGLAKASMRPSTAVPRGRRRHLLRCWAHPWERVYPRHHGQPQRRVHYNGLLIKASCLRGSGSGADHFARATVCRWRLSQAVIVVECPSKAVRSIASLAWEQGCPSGWSPPMLARPQPPVESVGLVAGATPLLVPLI